MRPARAEEAVVGVTARIAGREIGAEATGSSADTTPLRMVEDVVGLRSGTAKAPGLNNSGPYTPAHVVLPWPLTSFLY